MQILFDALPNDDIGVVAFAYKPFLLAPFSSDKNTLKIMVDGVSEGYINMGSTDYIALSELASKLLKKRDPKIVILFTDGGDEEAIAGLTDELRARKIDLYVVLIGTKEGSPVLDAKGNFVKRKDGETAITQRNDALGIVAKENGGDYVIASTGKEDIERLVTVIKAKYKERQHGEVKIKQRVEYYYYPLGLGLLLLLISLSSLPKRKRS